MPLEALEKMYQDLSAIVFSSSDVSVRKARLTVLLRAFFSDRLMLDHSHKQQVQTLARPMLIVFACNSSTLVYTPFVFRNFDSCSREPDRQSYKDTIINALLASSAAPWHLHSHAVKKGGDTVWMADGGLLLNNPVINVHLELQEQCLLSPKAREVFILSLGTGRPKDTDTPRTTSEAQPGWLSRLWETKSHYKPLYNVVGDCSLACAQYQRLFKQLFPQASAGDTITKNARFAFLRLNPQYSAEIVLTHFGQEQLQLVRNAAIEQIKRLNDETIQWLRASWIRYREVQHQLLSSSVSGSAEPGSAEAKPSIARSSQSASAATATARSGDREEKGSKDGKEAKRGSASKE